MITQFKLFENKGKWIGPFYHGSGVVFDKFSLEKSFEKESKSKYYHVLNYLGFHFTPDKNMALRLFSKEPEFVVYTVKIKVNKTLKMKESEIVREMLKWGHENGLIEDELSVRTGHPIPKSIPFKIMIHAPYWELTKMDREYYPTSLNSFLLEDKKIDKKKLALGYKQHLIEQGYDSIEYMNEIEWSQDRRWDWIVFDDNQVKIINIYKEK